MRDKDMTNQIFWAVYDTSADSDYFSFNTFAEAEAEVTKWLDGRLDYELRYSDCAVWGRFYVCAANADTVPDDNDGKECDEWSLWNYGGEGYPVLTLFLELESWGECAHYDINPERFTA